MWVWMRRFWHDLDGLVRRISHIEKLIIEGDFNGHIGTSSGDYDGVYDGFDFGVRNRGGTSLLDNAKAFELVIANSCFQKKDFLGLVGHVRVQAYLYGPFPSNRSAGPRRQSKYITH